MNLPGQHAGLARLRGLAALLVVFGHAFHPPALTPAQYILNPAFLLISSATVIFVLIAGILFRIKAVPRLMDGSVSTGEIVRRRWSELSGTYLTVGLFLATVIGYKEGVREGINPLFHGLRMVLNGAMAQSYWYVPFFLLLMALSPLHVRFCRLRLPIQIALIVAGSIMAALVHRPDAYVTFGAVHALVYYLPVFWIGLIIGAHFQDVVKWLHGKETFLGVLVLSVVGLQMVIGQDQVYLHKPGENWGDIDLFILQKILFALVFISVFHRSQTWKMPLIDWLSRHSLIIFFMHPPILILLISAPHLSGFYTPELVAVTVLTIIGGLQLHRSLARIYGNLPTSAKSAADAIKSGRLATISPQRHFLVGWLGGSK